MQQMMEGTGGSSAPANWWSLSASMPLPQPSNSEMWQQDHDHGGQDLPESWCQLLLGGFTGEEDQKHGLIKRTESDNFGVEPLLHEQVVSSVTHTAATGFHDQHHKVQSHGSSSWTQNNTVLQASSPRSCITTSLSTHSMLDFSVKPRHKSADHNNSSEGNSTETAPTLKKARVQGSSSPQSILKVRKEKLGDRITTLHQLVSPFGKTDTASVLQEAIGYIRFLQSQIEALSSPYLQQQQKQRQAVRQQQYHHHHQQQQQQQRQRRKHPGNKDDDDEEEEEEEEKEEEMKKDLKSRGLCLVPVSYTMHVGGNNGADFWAPPLAGGF